MTMQYIHKQKADQKKLALEQKRLEEEAAAARLAEVAKAIAAKLGVVGANSTYTENAKWIESMAKDLLAHAGKTIVVAGDNQPPSVHALAHAMNDKLGSVGKTLDYAEPFQPFAETPQVEQLRGTR